MTEENSSKAPSLLTRLFDIRLVIAALLGAYGVLLLIAGAAPGIAEVGTRKAEHAPDRVELFAGTASNLWAGAAPLLVAAVFAGWALIGSRRAGS